MIVTRRITGSNTYNAEDPNIGESKEHRYFKIHPGIEESCVRANVVRLNSAHGAHLRPNLSAVNRKRVTDLQTFSSLMTRERASLQAEQLCSDPQRLRFD